MQIKYNLTVSIEGNSLDEIDDGLTQAATQRLMARLKSPPTLNGQPVPAQPKIPPHIEEKIRQAQAAKVVVQQNVQPHPSNEVINGFDRTANAPQVVEPPKKKAGRKPKGESSEAPEKEDTQVREESPVLEQTQKVGKTSQELLEEKERLQRGVEHQGAQSSGGVVSGRGSESNSDKNSGDAKAQYPTYEEVLTWIRKLCEVADFTKGVELLARFGASKAKELKESDRGEFILLCKKEISEKGGTVVSAVQ